MVAILLLTHGASLQRLLAEPVPAPTDLTWHVEQATDNMVRWTVRMSGFDPVKEVREGGHTIPMDMTHNVGRAIDGLLKAESVTGKRTPPETLKTLKGVLFATLDNEAGFPATYDPNLKKKACSAHNIREAVQALLELAMRRDDQQATERLNKLLNTLLEITDEDGAYRPHVIAQIPLLAANSQPDGPAAFTDQGDLIYDPIEENGF